MKARRNTARVNGVLFIVICILIVVVAIIFTYAHRTRRSAYAFHGIRCKADCNEEKAGYDWADEHGLASPSDCPNSSSSFIDGCRAYVAESKAKARGE
jgi:hypothetical protein